MATFPAIDFTQYQWVVNDQDYLNKWNAMQNALDTLQGSIDAFGTEVEQEQADTLAAAEQTRQKAISDTNAIKAQTETIKTQTAAIRDTDVIPARNTAQQAASDAALARDKSRAWAESETEIEPGSRSSKYWAGQAQAITDSGLPPQAGKSGYVLATDGDTTRWDVGTVAITQALTAPAEAADIGSLTIDASAVSRQTGGSIAAFEVTWWDGVAETVAASGGGATLSHAVDQPVGGAVSATVRALDDLGNASRRETITASVIANNPPTGPITINAPTQTPTVSTFQVSMSGATDDDGGAITYAITETGAITFGKTTDIGEGEIVTATAPDVTADTGVTFSVVAVDQYGVQSAVYSKTVTVLAAQVIGVEMTATGGPGGTWNHIDETGAAITSPTASWFNGHPVFGGMTDVVVDGQDMVEIPKFYYKRGTSAAGNPAWWISDQPLAGFAVMPAFMLDGVEVAAFQYGKYQASLSGGKLQSVPGVLPAVGRSLTQFLADAEARNVSGVAGFRLHHYDMWLAIQWLYLIENATMDSQTATGEGRVNESSAAVVDASDVAQASYRGIVGLWGNVYQWMDGTRTLNSVIQRRSYNGSWASTGESVPNGGGLQYPITFRATGDEQFIANTYSTSNDASATLPDYRRWYDGGEYYPCVGGYWSNGANAGLWCVLCSYSASFANSYFGARLARIVS